MFSETLLRLVERAVEEGHLARRDLLRIVCSAVYDPEWVRLDLARWLSDSGIRAATGTERRSLSACPFSEKELRSADERNEIPVVIPAGMRREHLAMAFNMRHWVFGEAGVTSVADGDEDRWLLICAGDDLFESGESCSGAMADAEALGQTGLSLEEYILFSQRVRYLTGNFPDSTKWTWLPRSSYVSSLVLCAGFPGNNELFLNLWPWDDFHSNVGLRLARRSESRPRTI